MLCVMVARSEKEICLEKKGWGLAGKKSFSDKGTGRERNGRQVELACIMCMNETVKE